MGVKIHKKLWSRLRRIKRTKLTHAEVERLEKYKTVDFLRTTLHMARLTIQSFWRKHKVWSRLIALFLVLLILFNIYQDLFKGTQDIQSYDLSGSVSKLLDEPIPLYSDKLVFDQKEQIYNYNADYQPGGEVNGDSYAPKIQATFKSSPEYSVSVSDPVNKVSVTFKPKFSVKDPIKDKNRVVYPFNGLGAGASKVYTLKGTGVKEDIVLRQKPSKDTFDFKYDVSLSDGTEMRMEADGSVGVYGVDTTLLGNVSTANESDAELLQKARENGPKTQFLFGIPAPYVVEKTMKDISPSVKANFSVNGNELTLHVKGLLSGNYPLSIDPTIYVETAQKLMRGNNESNIDFDVTNELIQKSQTTGARIDAWSSTTNLTSAVYGQGTAVAGGYIYSVGGVGSSTTSTSTYNTAGSTSFVVPAGVTTLTVKTWGAGGGGAAGNGGTRRGGHGGGGGYAKAVITVTPGETLTVDVGTAGAKAAANQKGGNGGGFSAVRRAATYLVQAGGGGGGGGSTGTGVGGNGGAGGGATASNGVAGSGGTAGGGVGVGGSGSAGTGGAAGSNGTAGSVGAANAGGNGGGTGAACNTAVTNTQGGNGGTGGGGSGGNAATCQGGGGGGGGRFGGGGSGSSNNTNRRNGGAGGGSSFINATGLVPATDVQTTGSGQTPGNSGDSDRGGLADGGTGATTSGSATAGDNGIVVLSYTTPGSVSSSVYWAKFNPSTNAIESPNPGTGACAGWCSNAAYDLPTALTGLSLVAYNGFLYAIGGSTSAGTPQTTVYIAKLGANGEPQLWHPTGGTPAYWFSDTALSNARSQFAALAYNNRMYILGGLTTSSTVLSTNTVQYADVRPNGTLTTWTSTGMQALTTARYGLTAHVYNDTIYALGGNATFSGSPVTTVEYSKLTTTGTMNAWTATSSFTSGRLSLGGSYSTIFGGYLYISGGCLTVNASGYCTSIATDVQLASINADGSLAPFNTILGLANDRFAHTLIAWQGGLYRLGGCRAQDASSGVCTNTVLDVDYGVINQDGDASTVSNSEPSGTSPCSGGSPTNCDLPPAGDGAGQGGQMSNAIVINNGFIYIIGGCTDISTATECYNAASAMSGNVSYAALTSTGAMAAPTTCSGTSYGLWCVDSTNRINGTAGVGTSAATVFNDRIYVIGGTDGDNWQTTVWSVGLNTNGSLVGAWSAQTFANLDLDVDPGTVGTYESVGYSYAFTRANPNSASTYPGNLYVLGGCTGGGTANGIGCNTYYSTVYKCNILTSGLLEEANANDCTTTGQMQIDADNINTGVQGLGLMAGTIYANRLYLVGGACTAVTAYTNDTDPCASDTSPVINNNANRKETMFARIDDSNNIVDEDDGLSTGSWNFATGLMDPVRRRAISFGYNGYIYSLAGYSGTASLQDLLFAKIDVSTGDLGEWSSSGVVVTPRWDLKAIVGNGYVYAIGGCGTGDAPAGCTDMQEEVQTFQLYNNDSGSPVSYAASAAQFTTDRLGSSSTILDGYVYVAGGCTTAADCTTATNSVQYAPIDAYGVLGTWQTGGNLPDVRAWGQLEAIDTLAGGTLYYIGGQSSTSTDERAEVYYTSSISTGNPTWSTATNGLPGERTKFSASVWNSRIYVTGGLNNAATSQNTVYVSPQLTSGGNISSTWSTSTAFDVARSGHTTIAYANNLYVLGGYDGTNYLNDVQFTQINTDGTVDPWTFSTSLPEPIRQGDGFAANGYMYLVGGRSDDRTCSSNTLVAPISANTTIASGNNPTGVGDWYETNVKYSGERYGNSVSYANGKAYVFGGACQAFPTVASVTTTMSNAEATTNNVTMPATVEAGDLLLTLFTSDDSSTVTTPAGWTLVDSDANGTAVRGSVFAKIADGTEDGLSVSFATSANQKSAAQVYRILAADWFGNIASGINITTTPTTATTANPDAPSLNPGSWATEKTLWIAYAAGSTYSSITSVPTGFGSGTHINSTTTDATGASATSAIISSEVDTLNPGTFTLNSSQASVTYTIAVRPAEVKLTGANRASQTAFYSQPQIAKYSRMIDTDTDVFPTSWLMNGLDNSVGARWRVSYRSMHDTNSSVTGSDAVSGVLQQNPNEDCGTSSTMPVMTTWGQDTAYGDVTLGDVAAYTALNSSGGNINCARYYYFSVSIDSSQAFGYPEDVTRGPTISDLSLFFTSDPSKRLRHGKTFTGGEQQPLDTPCRQSVDAQCPLP